MSLKLFCLFPVWRKCRSTFLPPFFPPISHLLLTWRKWYTQYSKERGISSIYSANTGLFMATVGFVFLPGTLSTVFWPSAHFTPSALYLTWCFQKHPTPTTLLGATGRHTVGQHTSAIVQQKSGSSCLPLAAFMGQWQIPQDLKIMFTQVWQWHVVRLQQKGGKYCTKLIENTTGSIY